ncbi:MAG TPA: glutamate-1-semialdehyde 2,1-aminomutase [Thiomonas arsenitoxydans]|jgi:glutamate-1-semialdehyde 2,1-aminomutase|uniref:glutamate-1-semialdehyde 2,1-aminomutase n=1 Tax=Thiomonas arsenitoxydans (strain DSM 22701 / CIP 110005 / 3As) TaxID=426114 RepID=UPI002BE546E9|nr:glutamate-1-semialdehyde 2,1-aminomutase [Thiomonas arsenitoxydans]HML83230.1 glutamate-1-semialdehyde 2,1-aminomutase [Thiomonas arsenitoxydans]
MTTNNSLFQRAIRTTVGGVNSPVRAFGAVGGTPPFIVRGEGPYVWDVEGNRYIDYIGSWGPLIAGHAHPRVLAEVQRAASLGLSFGMPTEDEVRLAEEICKLVPSIEQVRLVCSGTEATMSAIRLARGATGRSRIVKFEGCYHGHADSLLVRAGSGALTFGNPSSAGVPDEVARLTTVLPYNDVTALNAFFDESEGDIAAVIVEPIAANMNLIPATRIFLETLRELCTRMAAILIFDEVLTGFRVALGGAQAVYGITPDLTCLGKIIGGGMPLAAFGGRADLMRQLAPLGPVYQAGTLSGNPIAVAAGLGTLSILQQDGFYERVSHRASTFAHKLAESAASYGIPFSTNVIGGIVGMYFRDKPPQAYAETADFDKDLFNAFFHRMLKSGVCLPPSMYEVCFMSDAHDEEVIERTLEIAGSAFSALRELQSKREGKALAAGLH